LLFALVPDISNLSSPKDQLLIDQGARDLVNAIEEDRANILRADAFRSLVFVLLSAGLLFFFSRKVIKAPVFIAAFSLLILIDLWPVNKRYINNENFVPERNLDAEYTPNAADQAILEDDNLAFRVYDLASGDPFTNSRASYFHHSVGGYHGAKMRRYQEVIDSFFRQGTDPEVLDMLNTRYIIQRGEQGKQPIAIPRSTALGNAWFVDDIRVVENADEEILQLHDLDPSTTALVDKRYLDNINPDDYNVNPGDTIWLESYAPNRLAYRYSSDDDVFAVFSEIFYSRGWKATINGEEAEINRVNYILRGLSVPAGEGEILFEFKPVSYFTGRKVAFAGSLIMTLLVLGTIAYYVYSARKKETVSA
jgi:hypothetical protein